jgi:serine/threonine protein kinase
MVKTKKNSKNNVVKKLSIGFEKENTKQKKKESKIDFSMLKFKKSDLIGEGAYSKVYKFRYGNGKGKVNNKYVVKKIKVLFLKRFYGEFANQEIINLFNNELRALIHLSKLEISPKIYGIYSDVTNDKLYYILEKMDTTLGSMLRNKEFKIENTVPFISLLHKMLKTRYRHTDLHIENIMYDKQRNQFFLIDFGHHKELSKENSDGFFYTENSQSEDYVLFDKTRGFENSIIGTSGASAISQIYKFLVLKILKDNDKHALKFLQKLKLFIKKYSSSNSYKNILNILNDSVGVSEESKLKLTKMKVFN